MLGPLPVYVHLGQRHFPKFLTVPGGGCVQVLESFNEFLVRALEGFFRINANESGIVNEGEQQVAKLTQDSRTIASFPYALHLTPKLFHLFLHLLPYLFPALPVKAYTASFILD